MCVMAASTEKSSIAGHEDRMRCFVCDGAATGRYYILATCRTQTSRIRLIEKLGQLVGERYMVVISEDDVICRSCANLMNTLDRLETEMGSVRNVVLRFLEKKYALEEGELLNNKTSGVPLPQVSSASSSRKTAPTTENFMSRKRKAALAELESERENSIDALTGKRMKNDPKKDIWMQCDKCKYTTNLNSFMINHIRQHVKKKQPDLCEFCGGEIKAGSCSNNCSLKKRTEMPQSSTSGTSVVVQNSRPVSASSSNFSRQATKPFSDNMNRPSDSDAETVQMIAAEINEYITARSAAAAAAAEAVVTSAASGTPQLSAHKLDSVQQTLQDIPHAPDGSSQISVGNVSEMQRIETTLNTVAMNGGDSLRMDAASLTQNHGISVPGEHMQNGNGGNSAPTAICVMNMSEQNSAVEQTLLVQNMNDDNNAVYVQVVEVGKGDEVHDTSNMPKQVLTVADDGTVEMVEVMWNEMVSSHVSSGQDVQF
ncbi:uncharacterized protein LOC124802336 isoform X1 [Schistocerca piceifrons]|uniref:uncharacterized protein LOC124802336 isoform X1 n=3 Tax=Schistocerca piceifrons TaxID=274613 RepID=UPI001F5E5F02|nr:uncharacterized protein LOC124802336 isoform X1 [Schistocerca piceifrons]